MIHWDWVLTAFAIFFPIKALDIVGTRANLKMAAIKAHAEAQLLDVKLRAKMAGVVL